MCENHQSFKWFYSSQKRSSKICRKICIIYTPFLITIIYGWISVVNIYFLRSLFLGCGNTAGRDDDDRDDRDERDERSHFVTGRRYNDLSSRRRFDRDDDDDDDDEYDRGHPRDGRYERDYERVNGRDNDRDYDDNEMRDVSFSSNKTNSGTFYLYAFPRISLMLVHINMHFSL